MRNYFSFRTIGWTLSLLFLVAGSFLYAREFTILDSPKIFTVHANQRETKEGQWVFAIGEVSARPACDVSLPPPPSDPSPPSDPPSSPPPSGACTPLACSSPPNSCGFTTIGNLIGIWPACTCSESSPPSEAFCAPLPPPSEPPSGPSAPPSGPSGPSSGPSGPSAPPSEPSGLPSSAPSLTAKPRIVNVGSTGVLQWNTGGIDESSCTLTGGTLPNSNTILLHDTTTASGGTEATSGTYSVTVGGKTTYRLTCPTGSATATFEVVPIEFET